MRVGGVVKLPFSAIQDKIDDKLSLTGGTLKGKLIFDASLGYNMISKYRTINDVNYELRMGLGIPGSKGALSVEIFSSEDNYTTALSRFDVRADGRVTYVTGGTTYDLYGAHNYQNIKLGKSLNMFDGVNLRNNVIQCLDDGDSTNYGSELLIGAGGNTYIGSGESVSNFYAAQGVSNDEQMYICSDQNIYFYSNCNTIANRNGIGVGRLGVFYPLESGGFTLGNATYKWGQIYSTASSISTSDRNEKHDINPVDTETVENLIMGLQPVTYKYDNGTSDRLHYGLIAQDIEELLDNLNIPSQDFAAFIKSQKEEFDEKSGETTPVTDENGEPVYIYGLRYEEFVAPLIKMVQMQQKKIETQETEILQLKNKVINIEEKLQTL